MALNDRRGKAPAVPYLCAHPGCDTTIARGTFCFEHRPKDIPKESPKPAVPDVPRISLEYILDYCATNPARFKAMHAHVKAVREWLEMR